MAAVVWNGDRETYVEDRDTWAVSDTDGSLEVYDVACEPVGLFKKYSWDSVTRENGEQRIELTDPDTGTKSTWPRLLWCPKPIHTTQPEDDAE